MHIPEKLKMNSYEEIQEFIKNYSFAAVISADLEASHLPLIFKSSEGEMGTLYGHFARTNPHWKLVDSSEVLVIFSGPHSYISPTWYESKPAVPTWNYSAVHVRGIARLTDKNITLDALDETVKKYEPNLSIPEDFKSKLSNGIIGFKIEVSSIEGKEKLGQHRSKADQLGVVAALSSGQNLESQQLYQYMLNKNIGLGN